MFYFPENPDNTVARLKDASVRQQEEMNALNLENFKINWYHKLVSDYAGWNPIDFVL